MSSGTEQQAKQQPEQHAPAADNPLVMNESPVTGSPKQDRRMSDEWDASKVPPSRFQKRKGSIYATPNSRDGHIDRNYADKYHAKIAEMKGGK
ncbi:phosphatase PSR2 [Purpureocillium lavendulum]|uniref:Phosphatase PSR2 n=1 Tax=Purpureocillium lavendulum TaxID=1247861 RepID=A0AB34FUR1_9HYPO|nr:phosphatase PSR2 [Purpureocillium lavendulum]